MRHEFFHWPDHVIGKRESRQIREAHNATLNDYHELLETTRELLDIVEFEYANDPEREDLTSWKRAIDSARAAIAKAKGGQ